MGWSTLPGPHSEGLGRGQGWSPQQESPSEGLGYFIIYLCCVLVSVVPEGASRGLWVSWSWSYRGF